MVLITPWLVPNSHSLALHNERLLSCLHKCPSLRPGKTLVQENKRGTSTSRISNSLHTRNISDTLVNIILGLPVSTWVRLTAINYSHIVTIMPDTWGVSSNIRVVLLRLSSTTRFFSRIIGSGTPYSIPAAFPSVDEVVLALLLLWRARSCNLAILLSRYFLPTLVLCPESKERSQIFDVITRRN